MHFRFVLHFPWGQCVVFRIIFPFRWIMDIDMYPPISFDTGDFVQRITEGEQIFLEQKFVHLAHRESQSFQDRMSELSS